MLLQIIDTNNEQYIFEELNSEDFSFSFTKKTSEVGDYQLIFTSKHEIPMETKAAVFSLFENKLKNILIDQVVILLPCADTDMILENDAEYLTLFDSQMYNLHFDTINYYTEYRIPGNLDDVNKPFEQIALSFVFTAN